MSSATFEEIPSFYPEQMNSAHILRTCSASELGSLANESIQRSEFFRFGQLMLHDLNHLRSIVAEQTWQTLLIPKLRSEPFYARSQEDPFSRRSTHKPRGYAGDAHLIDFLYRSDAIGD